MTELFGDRTDFAIEVGVEPNLKPPSAVWGHMCIWTAGLALGAIEDRYCALYPAYRQFRSNLAQLEDLWAPEFEGLDAIATLNFLDGMLYGYHGDVELKDDRSDEQVVVDSQRWGRHNFLTHWGEQFDGYKSFIVHNPSGPIRVLSYKLPRETGLCVEVSREAFVLAVTGFVRWFQEQESRLSKPQEQR